jgi:hypothetical protein
MSSKPSLKLVLQPQAYFYELVTHALGNQKLETRPETEFYLVNLLNQFMTADRLPEEPLALMVKDALEAPGAEQARTIFQKVGDTSLYVAGYFQESLSRKLVDVDYYIEMGGTAYQQVAARAEENRLRELYSELADKFAAFVEVLGEISAATTQRTEQDILRLYEVWVRTKSERAAKALQEAGIIPNDTVKKDWQ